MAKVEITGERAIRITLMDEEIGADTIDVKGTKEGEFDAVAVVTKQLKAKAEGKPDNGKNFWW